MVKDWRSTLAQIVIGSILVIAVLEALALLVVVAVFLADLLF